VKPQPEPEGKSEPEFRVGERLVERYAGQMVTRRCETCGQLFDVQMPPRTPPS
jgi:hypothetical protein